MTGGRDNRAESLKRSARQLELAGERTDDERATASLRRRAAREFAKQTGLAMMAATGSRG